MEDVLDLQLSSGDVNLRKQLEISRENLGDELFKQPSLYAWWSVLCEQAKHKMNRRKLMIEVVTSQTAQDLRGVHGGQSPRLTETALDQMLRLDTNLMRLKEEYEELALEYGTLLSAVRAFEQRKDMLLALSYAQRYERELTRSEAY